MTMGALHAGHETLLRAAREQADHVLVTIFVNPLQFGPNEDFDRYPRTLDADLEVCRRAGVDLVFAPDRGGDVPGRAAARYACTRARSARCWRGRAGPASSHGVLTVVLKLLQLTRPDLAFFGEKDYQQLTLIRRMARDLDVPVEIVGVPTVREPDGLALSSRNRYLSTAERRGRAGACPRRCGPGAAPSGSDAGAVLAAAHGPRRWPGVRRGLPGAHRRRPGPGPGVRAGAAAGRRLGGRHPADRQPARPPRPALTRPHRERAT